jgi:regulatory protein
MAFALRLLAAKPRSRAELRERLQEKCDDDAIVQVMSRLEELGYVNDKKFATSFAAARIATRPLGRVRLRRDLQRRKVSGEVAESAMNEAYAETNEETLIEKAIEKRLRTRGEPRTRQDAQKLFAYLLRQGFDYDLVMRKVREKT